MGISVMRHPRSTEMRRTLLGGVLFWLFLAPSLLYPLMALTVLPVLTLRLATSTPIGEPGTPIFQFVVSILASAGLIMSAAIIWWIWRIYRGDSPTDPKFPSPRAIAVSILALSTLVVIGVLTEPRGSSTIVDPPWLVEPVPLYYPYHAMIQGRAAVVNVELIVSETGEILRYELSGDADSEFLTAVSDAIAMMRIDTQGLNATEFPFTKRFKVPFVPE
jgi:hypothetical protein